MNLSRYEYNKVFTQADCRHSSSLYKQSLKKRAEEAEERRIEADQRRRGQELLVDVTSHELRQVSLGQFTQDSYEYHFTANQFRRSSTAVQLSKVSGLSRVPLPYINT
jgi:hypothetical protein